MGSYMNSDKLDTLAVAEGYPTSYDLIEERGLDSTVPGICMNDGCEYITQVEPDQSHGYCEQCKTNTVLSCCVLVGII